MTLQEYILDKYPNDLYWFQSEVNDPVHAPRISRVISNKNYLTGIHNILGKEDTTYKGKSLVTKKTILNYLKTIIRFHDTYLLGNPVSISANETTAATVNEIYKLGSYEMVDYSIIDHVNKFGDAFEVVYVDTEGLIKSKVLDNADCYPIYTDCGEYIGFIEHWTDAFSACAYWNVHYPDHVESYTNAGGDIHLTDSKINVCGLPIHYHNFNDEDNLFGRDMLYDIVPIMDDLEDIMSKLGDAIYVNTLNPMPVAIGQRIDSSIPADATGYVLNLDVGDFKYANANIDYNTVKLYLDNMKQMLNDIACIPSVVGSNTNVANVSEVSMKILYAMANVLADENKKWLNKGFQERFNKFKSILGFKGLGLEGMIEVVYNVSMPVATTETINNMKVLQEMGAISTETIMEKTELVGNVEVEKQRLKSEEKMNKNTDKMHKDTSNDDENRVGEDE